MIHCALLGSIERFLSVFIEHTGGWFPFWAAPEQVRILTINDTVSDYVSEITAILDGIVLDKPIKYMRSAIRLMIVMSPLAKRFVKQPTGRYQFS
jgi:threonyl-tRNA synthetase